MPGNKPYTWIMDEEKGDLMQKFFSDHPDLDQDEFIEKAVLYAMMFYIGAEQLEKLKPDLPF